MNKIVVVFMMVWMAWFSNVVFCIEDTLPTSNIGVTQNGQLSFGGGLVVFNVDKLELIIF